jgi:hypothetical protein
MRTIDIPQANDLAKVRAVVAAVAHGAQTLPDVIERTGYSLRHVEYRVHAARILGFVRIEDEGALVATAAAERLLATGERTHDERAAFAQAIEASPELKVLAPELLGRQAPLADDLCERLIAVAGLSPATAMRRALGLLAWRRQVLDQVLPTAAPVPAASGPLQLTLF